MYRTLRMLGLRVLIQLLVLRVKASRTCGSTHVQTATEITAAARLSLNWSVFCLDLSIWIVLSIVIFAPEAFSNQ